MENELNINSEPTFEGGGGWLFWAAACESIQTMMPSSVPLKLQWSALKEMGRDYIASIASTASVASIEVKRDVIIIDAL